MDGTQPAPAEWEPRALHRGVWSRDEEECLAAWRELGRQAAREGWARRFLLDVLRGRLRIPPEAAVPAVRALARYQPELVLSLLKQNGGTARPIVGMSLGQEGDSFQRELIHLSEERDTGLQLAAIAGLAELAAGGSLDAVQALVARVDDPNGQVRWAAAGALGKARGSVCVERAAASLEQTIGRHDEPTAAGAAFGAAALWPAGRREAKRILLNLAESSSGARRAVALAIGELPRRAAARLAKLCLDEPDGEVRLRCVSAVSRWAKEGSQAALRELHSLARDVNPAVRAAAAEALASGPDLANISLVSRLATDPSALVRASVADGLVRRGDPEARQVVVRLARDRAGTVRAATVRALGALGEQHQVREACRDREPMVRAAAAAALQPKEPGEAQILLSLSQDRHTEVVREAARSLGRAEGASHAPIWDHLVKLASEPATYRAAAEGLAAALDNASAETVAELTHSWPVKQLGPEPVWAIARCARSPLVSEFLRTLAHLLEGGHRLGDSLQDLSVWLADMGRDDLAETASWLAKCANATTAQQIAALVAEARAEKPHSVSDLLNMGQAVGKAFRARSAITRKRYSAQARRAAQLALARESATPPSVVTRAIISRWERLLEDIATGSEPGEIQVALRSSRVVAGPLPTVLVRVENVGKGPADAISVSLERSSRTLGHLPPGGSAEIGIPLGEVRPGLLAVRGQVEFRDGTGQRAASFEGKLRAVPPGALRVRQNPYVVGKPLAGESAMFFGRAAEMAFVERALAGGEGGSVVVLVGQRRTGKTSLLKRLAARLADQYRPVFVDIQGMLVSSTPDFFRELARRALRGQEHESVLREGGGGSGLVGAEMVAEAVARYGSRMVLLLDEFDDLAEKVRAGRLTPEVFAQLRTLIQHTQNVSFVLCGTHRLEELAGEYWSFLLNLATYRRLGPLEASEAEDLVRLPLEKLGVVCEDAAVALAVRLAGRQPYLLQLLGFRLVERCMESGEGAVRVALVEEAADEVADQGEIHLRYLWEAAGSSGQMVLRALAESDRWVSRVELERMTELSSEQLARAVNSLRAQDLVTEEQGCCRLCIGLVGRWLGKSQSDRLAAPRFGGDGEPRTAPAHPEAGS